MELRCKQIQQTQRAQAFVEGYRQAGFTPSDVVFMAEQRAMFDRGSHRGNKLGPFMLMDVVAAAARRMAMALDQIKTPTDLGNYRKNWIDTWASGSWKDVTKESATTLFNFIYKPSLGNQLDTWMDPATPANLVSTWEQALAKVDEKLWKMTLERDTPIEPVPLARAIELTGLHTFTWSKWLYPTEHDEAMLGGQLVAFNKGLQAQTGLEGPLLGLGGVLRLHLDDDTVLDHGGVFSNSLKLHNKTAGKNAFGTTQIRVPCYLSFHTLAHEWMHAFDFVMGDVHEHTMASSLAGTPAHEAVAALDQTAPHYENEVKLSVESALAHMRTHSHTLSSQPATLLEAFDQQMAQGTPVKGWDEWAVALGSNSAHHGYAVRSLATAGSILTQMPQGNVAHAWEALTPEAYLQLPEERLAFAFERACFHTHNLPCSAGDAVWWVRNCVASEQKLAHEALTGFFSHPQTKQAWDALRAPAEQSPLLDAVAARRLSKRRATAATSKTPAI